jgi:hypothetical protein
MGTMHGAKGDIETIWLLEIVKLHRVYFRQAVGMLSYKFLADKE